MFRYVLFIYLLYLSLYIAAPTQKQNARANNLKNKQTEQTVEQFLEEQCGLIIKVSLFILHSTTSILRYTNTTPLIHSIYIIF